MLRTLRTTLVFCAVAAPAVGQHELAWMPFGTVLAGSKSQPTLAYVQAAWCAP